MAYGADPDNDVSDWIRLRVGDTSATEILSDAEYDHFVTSEGNKYAAAAAAARAIAAEYSTKSDKTIGKLSIRHGELAGRYLDLAKKLEKEGRARQARPVFTGQSISTKADLDADTDAVQPRFQRGQFEISPDVTARPKWENNS